MDTGESVFGDTRGRAHSRPEDRGRHEPRNEEVDVVDPPGAGGDRAAEDVAEHEQEQHARDGGQDDQLRRAQVLEKGAPGCLPSRGQEARTTRLHLSGRNEAGLGRGGRR